MALALRMNGAPLSGALFVSNPAPRKAKANKAKVKANGRKRKTSARKRKGLLARAIARLRANTRGKARSNGKAGRQSAVSRALARLRARRNTSHMAHLAGKGKVKANRRRSPKAGRRNLALATYANKRTARRNTGDGFSSGLTAPVAGVVRRVPIVGSLLSGFVGPLVVGAVVGAVHYYGVKAAQAAIPGVVQAINPAKFTAAGVAVGGLMAVSGKIPGLNRIPANLRKQIGVAAVLVGGALDVYRALSKNMGDLGVAIPLYDTADAVTLPGYADAVPLYDYSGIAVETQALGDGFAYDVVPGSSLVNYGSAAPGDAAAAPDDLSVEEGEAALAGADAWMHAFGPTPVTRTRVEGYYSPLAGRPGHRFGWLIQLVGFDRFQRIAALPPAERCDLIARLKAEAMRIADEQRGATAQIASGTPAQSLAGLAVDLGAPLFAGSHI